MSPNWAESGISERFAAMSRSWSADSRRTEQKSGDYFGGCGTEGTVKVSFSGVSEGGNVMAADWKRHGSACGTNKRPKNGFQHSQHGKSAGIGGQTLD